jgi:hypothetical protein
MNFGRALPTLNGRAPSASRNSGRRMEGTLRCPPGSHDRYMGLRLFGIVVLAVGPCAGTRASVRMRK